MMTKPCVWGCGGTATLKRSGLYYIVSCDVCGIADLTESDPKRAEQLFNGGRVEKKQATKTNGGKSVKRATKRRGSRGDPSSGSEAVQEPCSKVS